MLPRVLGNYARGATRENRRPMLRAQLPCNEPGGATRASRSGTVLSLQVAGWTSGHAVQAWGLYSGNFP